jgi:hypothetical protein
MTNISLATLHDKLWIAYKRVYKGPTDTESEEKNIDKFWENDPVYSDSTNLQNERCYCWKDLSIGEEKIIGSIAATLKALIASEACCERGFSFLRYVYSMKRRNLTIDKLETFSAYTMFHWMDITSYLYHFTLFSLPLLSFFQLLFVTKATKKNERENLWTIFEEKREINKLSVKARSRYTTVERTTVES